MPVKAKEIRIQKALSEAGFSSRRKAEELVKEGRVRVDGRPAEIGMKVGPKQIITVDGKRINSGVKTKKYYIALHKPRGYVTTMDDELGRKNVSMLVEDIDARLYPVGRLDMSSEGLLIMTNDGEFANLLMHPSHNIKKIYRVTIDGDINDEQLTALCEGVEIDGRKTAPTVTKVVLKEEKRTVLQMTLSEGRNRQIRKMFEIFGIGVKRLRRIQVGAVRLGVLRPGEHRPLTKLEIETLKSQA